VWLSSAAGSPDPHQTESQEKTVHEIRSHRKILRVDLTARKHRIEEPDDIFYRTYCGGSALACYYLLKERRAGVDPWGPTTS